MKSASPHVVIVGGGAAGFFAAIAAAEIEPDARVTLLERSAQVLAKVKISGGGRCNVTHACFDPAELVMHYPRGGSALRGPFSRFQPRDTVEWFESRGVPLKTEEDNRIFPKSDRSESIIECLQAEAARVGVTVRLNADIRRIHKAGDVFKIDLGGELVLECDRLILATGSNAKGWEWARALGHSLVPPVPSLFTFQIADPRLEGLAGISLPAAVISLEGSDLRLEGPVLITHEGLSGPVVLKLSAWAARDLHVAAYRAALRVNWTGERLEAVWERLKKKRAAHGQNLILADSMKEIPRRLWARLALAAGIRENARWTEVGNDPLKALAQQITGGIYQITGKSVFKEEFVTAGGVALNEVDFRTMQSKRCPGLYFAGEILDIDAETGGFNFQNAWTTGWLAGTSTLPLKPQKTVK
jgi:predicted Rossmann fold flavoprotein